jgi:RNA polymerase sigma factor (sigma-70 family)
MATTGAGAITHHLRELVRRVDGPEMTDGQLLERFVTGRDSDAFESLVRRHGPMVLGVCRRVLRAPHDAEDAFQVTFLVLARKAASVSPREMVGNWLYGVAHTTAVRARAANAKRRLREKQVAEMPEPQAAGEHPQDELHQLLDEELARLPDKYRAAVVLCDLEGRPRKEVARRLHVPEGTLSSRLTTARRMLAKRLARLGLAISGGALAAAVAPEAAAARVPGILMRSTVQAAALAAAGQPTAGLVSAPVATLTEGVLKTMFLAKLKTVVPVLLVAGVVACGGVCFTRDVRGGPQAKAEQPEPRPATEQKEEAARPAGGWSVGHFKAFREPLKYKGIFLKMLRITAEHFEQISYANQYDGRIEARTVDAQRTGIIREGFIRFEESNDGSLSISVLVNKLRTAGGKSEVVGRDTDLEQVILAMREAQQVRGGTAPAQRKAVSSASEDKPGGPRTEPEGPPALKRAWRVVSVAGGEGAFDFFRRTDLVFVGGGRLLAAPNGSDDYAPASVYRVRLGAERPVREIDFSQKGDAGGTRLLGIYEVKGDELRLCLSARQGTRPTTLMPGAKQALLVARRIEE